MIVVSNSSPLIFLSAAGFLDFLKDEFGNMIIPKKVYEEIVVEGKGKKGSEDIKNAEWINVKEARDEFIKKALVFGLDDGETEAIATLSYD